jgi:hypothetical protein
MCVVRSFLLGTLKLGIVTTRYVESAGEGAWRWMRGLYVEAQRDLKREQAAETAALAESGWNRGGEYAAEAPEPGK